MKANAPRILAILTLVAALALSLASVIARDARLERIPAQESLDAAAAYVQENYRDEDQVVVVPAWRVAMYQRLSQGPKGVPQSALHQGDRIDPLDLAQASRVWVVSMFYKAPEVPSEHVDLGTPVSTEDIGGGVQVALYEQRAIKPVATLTEDFRTLRVTRTPAGGKPKACRLRGTRHQCDPGPNVDIRTDDVFHRPVRWLFIQPGPNDALGTIHWTPKAPKARQLVVRVGNNLTAVRKPGGSPVTFNVLLAGEKVATTVLPPYEYSLKRLLIDIPANAKRPLDIAFTVQAADPKRRYPLMQATLYDAPLPSHLAGWLGTGAERE